VRDHGGEVPASIAALVALRGSEGRRRTSSWARLSDRFGIVVDTHVHRVSRRLGLSEHDDPVKIELDLLEIVPRDRWIAFGPGYRAWPEDLRRAEAEVRRVPILGDCPHGKATTGLVRENAGKRIDGTAEAA